MNEQEKIMKENDVTIKNYKCGVHGNIKPNVIPSCPKCSPQPKEEKLVQPVDKYDELRKEFMNFFKKEAVGNDLVIDWITDFWLSKIKHLEEESFQDGFEKGYKRAEHNLREFYKAIK